MRNDLTPRGTWPAYVKAAREGAGLTKTELGRRVGVDRGTVARWESGQRKPDSPAVVATVADVLGLDREEALAAAGFRPGAAAPPEPTRAPDPELDRIRRSKLSPAGKARLIARITERRQQEEEQRKREQEQRLADLEDLIRAQERLER